MASKCFSAPSTATASIASCLLTRPLKLSKDFFLTRWPSISNWHGLRNFPANSARPATHRRAAQGTRLRFTPVRTGTVLQRRDSPAVLQAASLAPSLHLLPLPAHPAVPAAAPAVEVVAAEEAVGN